MTHRKKAEIMDESAVRRAINRISFEIIEKNKGSENVVLAGVQTRGQYIAKRIAEKINEVEGIQLKTCSIDISPFRDDVPLTERKAVHLPKIENIEQTTVIIVDDVLYTGRTVRAAIELISFVGRAKKIQLAVLIDRGHREVPIRPDYIGKNLPTSANEKVKVMMQEVDGNDSVVIFDKI